MKCLECDSNAIVKGLCRKHYYSKKRKSSDPKDIAIYRNRPAELSKERYAGKTPQQRIASVQRRRKAHREELQSVVPPVCALSQLSPCSKDKAALHQDHDHECACKKRTGCSKCFRGLLCTGHNRLVLPVVEKFYPEQVPKLVADYLKQRPLLGTGIEPF